LNELKNHYVLRTIQVASMPSLVPIVLKISEKKLKCEKLTDTK